MRFQTTNQVPCEDAELVLAVLEDRLHRLAHDVVREGHRITLFGLGPSPRAVNPRDKTMIDVSAADGVTTIDADVTFQASAFLGEAPQDQIVLGKLERVFEEIKAELGLKTRCEPVKVVPRPRLVIPIESAAVERALAVASVPEVSDTPGATVEMVAAAEDVSRAVVELSPMAEIEHAPTEVAPVARVEEVPVDAVPIPVAEPTSIPVVEPSNVAAEPTPIAAAEPTIVVVEPTPVAPVEAPIVVAEPMPSAVVEVPIFLQERAPIAAIKPQASAPVETERRFEDWLREAVVLTHKEERGGRGRIGWLAGGACVAVAAVVGARYLAEMQGAALSVTKPAAVAAANPAPVTVPAPVAATAAEPTTAPAPVPEPPKPPVVEDPAEVVKQWELAMQSRDAAAQAAFYADTVGRYFLRDNVGKDAVLADKQEAIAKRKGSWTVTMDRVKVDRNGDAATVSLVKHFMVRPEGEPASEWFVPSQLKLKREDGRWRIVSERDLGWASSLDELDG